MPLTDEQRAKIKIYDFGKSEEQTPGGSALSQAWLKGMGEIPESSQSEEPNFAKLMNATLHARLEDSVEEFVAALAKVTDNSNKKKSFTGYIKKSDFDALNISTVSIPANFAGLESQMTPTRLQEQFFRIVEVVENEDDVTITARHVWYDNLENYTLWKPTETTNYTAAAVCRNILNNAISPVNSRVASDCTDTKVGKDLDFERKNLVEAFLDPENGVCAKFGLSLIRNNWDFYCLKNVGYDRGIVIQNGKNLLGVERTESIENLATRICPIGKDKTGNIVWLDLNGKKYIDSPHINEYSYPRVEIYDTGLQIGKDDVTSDNIQSKLATAAQKHLTDDKVDLPEVTMTIEFLSLGDTEEYIQYRDLDKVYLYDILSIKDTVRGYSYTAQVIAVEHDILTGRLNSVTIGDLKNWDGTRKIATWQVPEVSGENIRLKSIMAGAYADGSITSESIGDNVILYAHFASATIDELEADTIDAVQAHIEELIAGHITADSIDTQSIDAINAKLGTATIAEGYIQNADIDFAHVKDMSVDHAIIETSITEQGTADKLFINRLMVTYGQMVQATIGDLVVGATDGNYYHVDVVWSNDGIPSLVPTQVDVTAQEAADGKTTDGKTIIGDVGTYAELSSTNFYAINGIIDRITAKRIDVDQLFAREATINSLNTADIHNNQYISIAVREQLGQGKQYYQQTEPTDGQEGDMWFQIDCLPDGKTWGDLANTTWGEIADQTWSLLGKYYYKTYRYGTDGWNLIDGFTSAQLEVLDNYIRSQVQRIDNGKVSITSNLQTADAIILSASQTSASQAATAKSEAISAASSDATTKANNAKDQAISSASSDATTKANNALASAKSDATSKANTAEANAKSYADSGLANKYTIQSNIEIKPAGIEISGSKYIKIKSGGQFTVDSGSTFEVSSPNLDINATELTVKQGIIRGNHYTSDGTALLSWKDIIVSTVAPSGTVKQNTVWIKPVDSTTVNYSCTISSSQSLGPSAGQYTTRTNTVTTSQATSGSSTNTYQLTLPLWVNTSSTGVYIRYTVTIKSGNTIVKQWADNTLYTEGKSGDKTQIFTASNLTWYGNQSSLTVEVQPTYGAAQFWMIPVGEIKLVLTSSSGSSHWKNVEIKVYQ